MSEIKHMPGPWTINHDAEYCGARIDGPNGRSIAHATQRDPHPTLGQGITQFEAEANARLIAAAPALLEACQEIVAWCAKNPPAGDALYCVQQARNAIAKATGAPRFPMTSCSQCGKELGPGDHGVSHCEHHGA